MPLPLLRRLRYLAEAAVAWGAYALFSLLPVAAASALGGALLRRLGPHLPSSAVARRNIAAALPDLSAARRGAIVRGMWDNLGRVLAEYAHLDALRNRMDVVGGEHIAAARASGRPVIFFTAHLANWEICPMLTREQGLPMHAVYRRPNNPYVDALLRRARRHGLAFLIGKGDRGAKEMLSVLRRNGTLGVMMDQKLTGGMAVPFFGRAAMTADAVARFALRFRALLHPARVERLNGCRFRVTIEEAIPVEGEDNEETVRQVLTAINARMESWIRARPEQWLWIHRRWPDDI